jgi:two-component system phosphate regulon sensor histidine kinase PhoR
MAETDRLFEELARLTEMVNSGDAGLPAVSRLVELTRETLGASGATFVEYSGPGGRVITASGDAEWAVGRFVDLANEDTARVVNRGPVVETGLAAMPASLRDQVRDRGIRRMLVGRVELAGHLVGTLHAFFPDDGPADGIARAAMGFFAGCVGHLYSDGRGLPVYADEPVVATSTDAIAVVGMDGTVRSWNAAASAVTGRSPAEAVGRPLPVPLPVIGHMLDHRLPDGRWLQILATELPGGDGKVVTLRDVTEARRREQARDLFVAVTSHELRTPVTVIKGYADTLVNHWDELDEEGRRDAAFRLGQRAGELARLVDRLLSAAGDGSAPGGGATAIPFDLNEALRSALANLPADMRRMVRVDLPPGLPKALGERPAIATVLSELVTNAIKYSSQDAPLEVTGVTDARTVGFRVADRGIGVRPEHVERAFDRFWQAESGNQRRYSGVGLGLYLVRMIIERQNGWVSLRPRESGGTVAEVRLPRADLGPAEA